MTQFLHLEGEEVFSLAKCSTHCFPRVDDNSHRLDHVNVFCPCVADPPSQPNNVNNMSINRLCSSHTMYPIVFQVGLEVKEIVCGDGIWHIDQCPLNFIVQCSALQNNTCVKYITKINTYKTTSGILIQSNYMVFWFDFELELWSIISTCFVMMI
jgi:hypothetical protein